MRFLPSLIALSAACAWPWQALASPGYGHSLISARSPDGELLQDIVTWDADSIIIRGERIFLLSGEYHPFRLPVPSLWIDNFQKIKAMGFNAVSFYTYWPLHEGNPGEFTAEGVFALEEWFKAAKEAGIYLIARPGPYINSESSGGGFPGWMQRVRGDNGTLRTTSGDFLSATETYMKHVTKIIADAQITNGGPVILVQAENEYSVFASHQNGPVGEYMGKVVDQLRRGGIIVPIVNNDVSNTGINAPGTGAGEVDIYGIDSYTVPVSCLNLYGWPAGRLRTNDWEVHLRNSPKTPFAVLEFQAGSYAEWDVPHTYDVCYESVNEQFGRVVYKNAYASGMKLISLYMLAGGTNWGNIGAPYLVTSYDFGSQIREDRTLNREAYSSMKLQGQFFKATPAYLASKPLPASTAYTNDSSLTVTPLTNPDDDTGLYVLRHTAYESWAKTHYKLKVPSSRGNLVIPRMGEGALTLDGRDSKIHVVDYDLGGQKLLYSSAEVLTWKKYGREKRVLVLYGGPNEQHEAAIVTNSRVEVLEGPKVTTRRERRLATFNWLTSPERTVLRIGETTVYLLDRNSAYNYFVPLLPSPERGSYGTTESNPDAVIVKAGYLVRSAKVSGKTLSLSADFNKTTSVEVIGAPSSVSKLEINGKQVKASRGTAGNLQTTIVYKAPTFKLPDLNSAKWKWSDSLPEISPKYDDSLWTEVDHNSTNNKFVAQRNPVVLFGGEYGFHSGYLVYRGHFTAIGNETALELGTAGGNAYGHSAWLDGTYIGSWHGEALTETTELSHALPKLKAGKEYVLTVVVDNNGQNMNHDVGHDSMKSPRGMTYYSLGGTEVSWKITGNLGGEEYQDRTRGPLNEGGSYAERQGWHLPKPPSRNWATGSPVEDRVEAGIRLYTTQFSLDMPEGWDIPLNIAFDRANGVDFRVQLFVNGWQFGKLIGRLGGQTSFSIPEGILNYRGENTVAITYWSQEESNGPTGIKGVSLRASRPVLTGRPKVDVVDSRAGGSALVFIEKSNVNGCMRSHSFTEHNY